MIGTWAIINHPPVVDVLLSTLDFVILDMEHGNWNYDQFQHCVALGDKHGSDVWVRVPDINENTLLHVLDNGITNIIVPHVQTKNDAEKFISYTAYPPDGVRGLSPFVPGNAYGNNTDMTDLKNKANLNVCRGVIIEDEIGLMNLESIVETGIDLVYFGIYDFASSLGITLPSNDNRIDHAITKILNVCEEYNISCGAIFNNKNQLQKYKDLGIDFLVYKTDTEILFDATLEAKEWHGSRTLL